MSIRSSNTGRSINGKIEIPNSEKRLKINSSTPANKQTIDSPPNGVAVFKTRPGTTIEVTVKTKDHIESPKMVNGKPNCDKKDTNNLYNNKTNWNQIFSEQTKSTIKGMQQPQQNQQTTRSQVYKSSKLSTTTTTTDTKKQADKRLLSKYNPRIDKLIDTIPQKLTKQNDNCQMINSSNYSVIMDNSQPITVFDKGIQCGGIFDCSSGNLSLFNPVRTLGFLMKELERFVHDDRASKILTEMEQALLRIPTEPGKITPEELESITMRNNLEAITTKLAEKSKQMEKMYETLVKDKERLFQQTREQTYLLEQANRRENELEYLIKRLKSDLNDANIALQNEQINRKKITDLEDDIKRMELIQKELKNDLHEQSEIAQQSYFDAQYLKLEKEKLTAMSAFKDSQLIDHRKAIKNLQNLIHNQLLNLSKESSLDDKFNSNPDVSTVIRGGGLASSSHLSPDNSIPPGHWREGSQFTISTVTSKLDNNNDNENKVKINRSIALKDESVQTLEDLLNESGGEKFKEKTHLEYTSFAGEEVSQSMTGFNRNDDDTIYKNLDDIDISNKRKSINHDIDNIEKIMSSIKLNTEKKKLKSKKSTNYRLDNKFDEEKPLRDVQLMFDNARIKKQFNVKVPSPLRQYPDPNWTDSSMPTMSVTESNII